MKKTRASRNYMPRIFQLIFWVLVFTFFSAAISAQEKLVKVNSIEIDGKPVKVRYEIDLITDKAITKAKTNNTGFFVPADLLANETIGVVVRLKHYVLGFGSVPVSNFNTDWVVGIDTEPFEK